MIRSGLLSPDTCQPWLLLERQPRGPVVVVQFDEACVGQVTPPGLPVMVGAVASAIPAFFVVAARIGAEQHATGLQRGTQLPQHARQLDARYVEQRCVGVDAVKVRLRQIESEKILLPYFAAAISAGHGHEFRGTLQADGHMAMRGEGAQVAARAAAEIENTIRRIGLDVMQQRADVLADVMSAGSVAKG